MTATIYQISAPGADPGPARTGLNLTDQEVQEASGGYAYAARQLRELHAQGFTLASIGRHGRVVLPRAHYEAVLRGQFRPAAEASNEGAPERPAPRPNRARLERRFSESRRK